MVKKSHITTKEINAVLIIARKPLKFNSDAGLQLISKGMQYFLKENGIMRWKSSSHNP